MRHAVLRATLIVAIVTLVFGASDSYGRGPAGRGGNGGGRAGAGRGDRGPEFAKRDLKKSDGPSFGAHGGPGGAAQKLNGAAQSLQGAPGKLKSAAGGAQKFQGLQQQAGQKWQSRDGKFQDGQHQQNAQNALSDFKNGPQPFTAQWYADHPNAWQATHPHADAWAVASAASVAAWLGWAAYPANEGYTTYNNTVVYEQTPADETASETAGDAEDVADQAASTQEDASNWLELGVYSVLSNSGEPTSRYLQLAVNRQGQLQGVYYDTLSNATQNIRGSIDQSNQTARWSIESNPQVTFSAGLADLTQPTGTIQVTQRSGQQQWRIAREENAS
jgi:hypothetical protein